MTNIVKNTSSIPFVGILLAAIQIGSLFALLSASRQKAKAEAASTKFFRGGKIPMFRTDEGGFEGNRIEGTNIEVGGNEFVVNRKVTNEHEEFLTRLNAGEYAGRDLEREVGESKAAQPPAKPGGKGERGASVQRTDTKESRESRESRFERWAAERFNDVVRERTVTSRDHFAEAKKMVLRHDKSSTTSRERADVLRSDVSRIATEAVTSQVMERVLSNAVSDTERHFFEQVGLALPTANQAHNFAQTVEGAQMYPVHVPGTSVVSRHERIYAAPQATDLAERFTDRTREATEAVSGMVAASRDDQSGKIVAAVAQQTNDLIRRGLLPLMQLGHRIVDAEGNTVHYSTDASGNARVSKLLS